MTQDEFDVQTEFFLETQVIMDGDFELAMPMPEPPPFEDDDYPFADFDPDKYYENGELDQ